MRVRRKAILQSVLSLAGLGCACAAPTADSAFELLMQNGVPVPEARGVWESRGYGWILALTDREMVVYEKSVAGCSADPRTSDFMRQFAYRRIDSRDSQLVIVQYPGENRYVFDRLPSVPRSCTAANWDPPHLFEHFVASYREQYAFFRERGVDWEQRVRQSRSRVTQSTTPRMLFAIFSDMLDSLGDAHVGLNARFRGEPVAFRTGRGATLQRLNDFAEQNRLSPIDVKQHWLAEYNRGIRQVVLRGHWQEAANGNVVWGRIGDDIGYINLFTVENFAAGSLADNIRFINDLMDRILDEFSEVKAIIVDVTNNTGGYDRLAREIAGHFVPERVMAYSKHAYGAAGSTPDMFYAEPSAGRRFIGPTYLMTSDVTVSGGEILTMTMRVLPNVTQIGTRTRGALSDRLTKVLPDGSDFSISNEVYLDPRGKLFEVVGVPPHHFLEIFPMIDLEGGHAKAVDSLVHEIRAGTVSRGATSE